MIFRKIIIFTFIAILFSQSYAQNSDFISVFNKLNKIFTVDDRGNKIYRGYKNYFIRVIEGDLDKTFVLFNTEKNFSKELVIPNCGNAKEYDTNLEWRCKNGVPFALIIKYKCFNFDFDDNNGFYGTKIKEYFLVVGLSGFDFYEKFDTSDSQAETKAREFADKHFR